MFPFLLLHQKKQSSGGRAKFQINVTFSGLQGKDYETANLSTVIIGSLESECKISSIFLYKYVHVKSIPVSLRKI